MPLEFDEKDREVLKDLVFSKGGTHADFRAMLEAVTFVGKRKRRELRVALLSLEVIRRTIDESRDELFSPGQLILDAAELALVSPKGLAAPEWHDLRRMRKLAAAGHTRECASRIVNAGYCVCHVNDAELEGRLPRAATAVGAVEDAFGRARVEGEAGINDVEELQDTIEITRYQALGAEAILGGSAPAPVISTPPGGDWTRDALEQLARLMRSGSSDVRTLADPPYNWSQTAIDAVRCTSYHPRYPTLRCCNVRDHEFAPATRVHTHPGAYTVGASPAVAVWGSPEEEADDARARMLERNGAEWQNAGKDS